MLLGSSALIAAAALSSDAAAQAQTPAPAIGSNPPNILVIWGDDIGTWNISHNSRGMMGYTTPNIDRIAREGVSFTDYYGQQSCTAGAPLSAASCPCATPDQGWSARQGRLAGQRPNHRRAAQGQGLPTSHFAKNHLRRP
jgi:arylsulfatase